MDLMICANGEPDLLPFLPEIAELGAGIELGSYGLAGVRSERAWQERLALHQAVRERFQGIVAVHGPFVGMEYGHVDHLIRDAVSRRLDMTFDVALCLRASRVVLHSGYTAETEIFNLEAPWLETSIGFWRREIHRWANAGVTIVLENDVEKSPDLLIRLADEVDSPFLGLCLDVGHAHVFSELDAAEWVRRMRHRLLHVHLHDNDRTGDRHWPIGRGTIDFEPFYAEVLRLAQQATLSLEVEDSMPVKMGDLRALAARLR